MVLEVISPSKHIARAFTVKKHQVPDFVNYTPKSKSVRLSSTARAITGFKTCTSVLILLLSRAYAHNTSRIRLSYLDN